MKIRRLLVICACIVAGAALCFLASVVFVFLLLGGCSEEDIVHAPSPSGEAMAILQERNCGATMAYDYRVKIGKADNSMKFFEVAQVYGPQNIRLQWENDNTLLICYSNPRIERLHYPKVRIYKRQIDVVMHNHIGECRHDQGS